MRRRQTSPFSLFSFQDIITGLSGIMIFFVLVQIVDLIVRRDGGEPETALLEESPDTEERLERRKTALVSRLQELTLELDRRLALETNAVSSDVLITTGEKISAAETEIVSLRSQVEALRTRLEKARDANARDKTVLLEMEATRRRLMEAIKTARQRNRLSIIPEAGNVRSPIFIDCHSEAIVVVKPFDKDPRRKTISMFDVPAALPEYLENLDSSLYTVVLLVRPSGVSHMKALQNLVRQAGFPCGRDVLEENIALSFDMGGEEERP